MKTCFSASRKFIVLLLASTFALAPLRKAQAEPVREFVLSATYGALAGTLVGAATLAFTDKPGNNLNRVARGASIGLYAGILLGLYVVYGVPTDDEDSVVLDDQLLPAGRLAGQSMRFQMREEPRLIVAPTFNDRYGVDGASAQMRVFSF